MQKLKLINLINNTNQFYKLAIHPNLFLTGNLDDSFLKKITDKIDNFIDEINRTIPRYLSTIYIKEKNLYIYEYNEKNLSDFKNKIYQETIRLITTILKNTPNVTQEKIDSAVKGLEVTFNRGEPLSFILFLFLHDAIHELLKPGSTVEFHKIPLSQQSGPEVYSPSELLAEDRATALTFSHYRSVKYGFYRLVEQILNDITSFDFTNLDIKEISSKIINTLNQKKESLPIEDKDLFSRLLKDFSDKLMSKINNNLINKNYYDSKKEVGDKILSVVEESIDKNILGIQRDSPDQTNPKQIRQLSFEKTKDIITDQQAKNVRLFLTKIDKVVDQSINEIKANRSNDFNQYFTDLAINGTDADKTEFAQNPIIGINIQNILVKDQNANVRTALASNPRIDTSVQNILSTDKNVNVRIALANNPRIDINIKNILAKDEDEDVRDATLAIDFI